MATYRVIVPFGDAAPGSPQTGSRYTTIQVEAESDSEAQKLAIAEFNEMAGLCTDRKPVIAQGDVRVERAPTAAPASFEVTASLLSPGVAVARLNGAINSRNYDKLQSSLDQLKSKDVSRLVLDLSSLSYINSTGMSLFIAAGDLFDMRLAAVPARITRLFRMIGLDAIFRNYMSVAEAAKAPAAGS
jgi:anti-sigma B factor antagonist